MTDSVKRLLDIYEPYQHIHTHKKKNTINIEKIECK